MWLYVAVIILTVLYVLLKGKFSYWKNLGVPGPDPLPFVGNIGQNVLGRKHVTEVYADIYMKYKQYSFVGFYRGQTPCILVRDPALVKNIMIKDFKHFLNNDVFLDKQTDRLVGRNPFVLKDDEWKKSRQQVVPAFSTGKIKSIFPLVENVGERMVQYLNSQIASKSLGQCLDGKEICTKFTGDNVAICALGLEGRCFDEPNSEFIQLLRGLISNDTFQGIKFSLTLVIPKITYFLSMKLLPKEVEDKLTDIVSKTIEYRKNNKITRNDFLDFVSNASGDSDLVEISAHIANFFIDGYETSASAMACVLLELAMSPECQNKAREEISSVLKSDNGEFSYESLPKMTYVDACISEALRKHPPLASLNRTCTEPYKMETVSPEYEQLSVIVEPGTPVIIPAYGLQMDPRHFPEPEKFIPERFLDKSHFHKYCYLPFGDGPRSCLGQRFGLIQVKIGLVQILRNFKFSLNSKTQLPITHLPYYILLFPKGGIWLDFQKI